VAQGHERDKGFSDGATRARRRTPFHASRTPPAASSRSGLPYDSTSTSRTYDDAAQTATRPPCTTTTAASAWCCPHDASHATWHGRRTSGTPDGAVGGNASHDVSRRSSATSSSTATTTCATTWPGTTTTVRSSVSARTPAGPWRHRAGDEVRQGSGSAHRPLPVLCGRPDDFLGSAGHRRWRRDRRRRDRRRRDRRRRDRRRRLWRRRLWRRRDRRRRDWRRRFWRCSSRHRRWLHGRWWPTTSPCTPRRRARRRRPHERLLRPC
jgi:hypothetical protein